MKILKQILSINRQWWASLTVIIIMTLCIVMSMGADSDTSFDDGMIGFDTGWISEKGESLSLSSLPLGNITLEHRIDGEELTNKRLCMKSIDTFFEVFADGNAVYSYYPELPDFMGKSYGMYVHTIPIPENTKVLTVKLKPIFPSAPPALLDTVIAEPDIFIKDLFKEGIFGFCICLLMAALGGVMMVGGLFSYKGADNRQIEFFLLGNFGVLVAMWSVNDTLILQMITHNPAMIRLINYTTLIFLPYFIVSFIASASENHKSPLLVILFSIICINFILNITLTTMGISDYFNLVKISQAVIVIAICMALYLVISAVRQKRIEKRLLRTFVIGTITLAVGAGIDIIRFRASSNVIQGTSLYARMGSLIFILLIGIYLIQENRRIQKRHSQELAELAYIDGLTGLKNRLAFNEAENSIINDSNAHCTIIQFDINNLKKVNDIYGHFEGDRHISGAAGIIRESVGDSGECYRTGGDEFIAIIAGADDEINAKNAIERMKVLVKEYNERENPPVVLDIAYGTAQFRVSEGTLEKAEQLADKRMYKCKNIQKSRNEIKFEER